jgi:hypothetical protein
MREQGWQKRAGNKGSDEEREGRKYKCEEIRNGKEKWYRRCSSPFVFHPGSKLLFA